LVASPIPLNFSPRPRTVEGGERRVEIKKSSALLGLHEFSSRNRALRLVLNLQLFSIRGLLNGFSEFDPIMFLIRLSLYQDI
jgi:hypothetical protein